MIKLFTSIKNNIKDKIISIIPFGDKLFNNSNIKTNTITPSDIPTKNNNILSQIDREIITQCLLNIYLKDLLIKIKTDTLTQYENESYKQKIVSDSAKDKHSLTHAKLLKNTEKLLKNINIIDAALASINEVQNLTKDHVKERLNFETIDFVHIKNIKDESKLS